MSARLLAQCRAGFEGDCAAELGALAAAAVVAGFARAVRDQGWLVFESEAPFAPACGARPCSRAS